MYPHAPCQLTGGWCRQVRSEAAAVHARVTAAAGRGLARSLKQLAGPWWVAQHDEYAEAARRSAAAFQTCFPGPKAKEAVAFCHSQVTALAGVHCVHCVHGAAGWQGCCGACIQPAYLDASGRHSLTAVTALLLRQAYIRITHIRVSARPCS